MKKAFRSLKNRLLGRGKKQTSAFTAEIFKNPGLEIGEWTYGTPKIYSFNGTRLKIGRFCSIANDVTILAGGEHRTDFVTTYPFDKMFADAAAFDCSGKDADVIIGSDVWIGYEALILSGARIGHGAVIGARSVVSGEVPPYAIFAGSPARLIRQRFPPEQVEALLRIAWWDWPLEKVREAYPLLLSNRISEFIRKYGDAA